ncbi:MAG: metallophosphoesterase [Candidatus Pacearchaeota archaeon]
MKFLHIADCHLGCWRNEKIEELSIKAFEKALDIGIQNNVDFVLISGDLFDTPMPPLNIVIRAIDKLREVKKNGIKIYTVAGSHDIAHNIGIINLLEASEIVKNVDFKKSQNLDNNLDNFIENFDEEVLIIGVAGKRNSLELEDIDQFKDFLEKNEKRIKKIKKIILLHSTVKEFLDGLLMQIQKSVSMKELPKADYYALGHLHVIKVEKNFAYPGPIFPTNFEELERLRQGNCFIVELQEEKVKITNFPLEVINVKNLYFSADKKNPFKLTQEILENITPDFKDKLVTLRIEGVLEEGTVSQIEFDTINKAFNNIGAILLKNISKLNSKAMIMEEPPSGESIKEIETSLLKDETKSEVIKELMIILDKEKAEGETNSVFEERLLNELKAKENLIIKMFKSKNQK